MRSAIRLLPGGVAGAGGPVVIGLFGALIPSIIGSQVTVADEDIDGEFDRRHVDALRDHLAVRPHAVTLGGRPFLDTDYQQFLLSVDPYDPSEHREFRQLIEGRMRLEIRYESVYGGEGFKAVYPQRGLIPQPMQETDYDHKSAAGGEPS